MFGALGSAGNDPIKKLQNWHSGAVHKQKEADKAADTALYNSTIEKFERAFDEVSKLDGSTELGKLDFNKKPGEVDVPGVGSLRKTADGFVLETVKFAPGLSGFGLGLLGASSWNAPVTPFRLDDISTKEIFTVNTNDQTIRHETKTVHTPPMMRPNPQGYGTGHLNPLGLGAPAFWPGVQVPWEVPVSDVTVNVSDKAIVARQKAADELGYLSSEPSKSGPIGDQKQVSNIYGPFTPPTHSYNGPIGIAKKAPVEPDPNPWPTDISRW